MLTAAESDDADGVVVDDVMNEGSESDAEEAAAKGGVNSKKGENLLVEFM